MALQESATCFGFLGDLSSFFTFFLGKRLACTGGRILTLYDAYDVFPRKDELFGSRVDAVIHLGVNSNLPKLILGRE